MLAWFDENEKMGGVAKASFISQKKNKTNQKHAFSTSLYVKQIDLFHYLHITKTFFLW